MDSSMNERKCLSLAWLAAIAASYRLLAVRPRSRRAMTVKAGETVEVEVPYR